MNVYDILEIDPVANIIDILKQYKFLCYKNPNNIFKYTDALVILSDKNKRILYDSSTFKIDIFDMMNYVKHYDNYYNVDEYELVPFVLWLDIFKDSLYDTKYYANGKNVEDLEILYNKLESILETIKSYMKSLYLA